MPTARKLLAAVAAFGGGPSKGTRELHPAVLTSRFSP